MNVFLVTSPFQYICANEARCHYATNDNILLLVKQDMEPAISQMTKIVNENDWTHVINIERSQRTFSMPKAIKAVNKIRTNSSIKHFFHGEYNGWRTKFLLRNLKPDTEIYFDDGSLTLGEYERFIKTEHTFYRPRFVNDLIIKMQGLKPIGRLPISKKLEIFTIFDIKDPTVPVVKNDFSNMRETYNLNDDHQREHSNEYALFLGQGSIDCHGTIKSFYLDAIKRFAKTTGKKILYAPHRTETSDIRKEILKIENLTYHDSTLPIELEIAEKQLNINNIGGIASTALYTLKIIYPHIKIYSAKQSKEEYHTQVTYTDNELMLELLKSIGIELF
ncbi:hypothetical protein EIJ81_02760 [Aliivibrio salmonicida]|uniref:Uncharacterized protein n=1 Tax=Aliivibrio salmonicida (strain LFI1238) TaxID=316275 RepID=B6EPC0_ALISL|nr:polysialyltransferase family glycosyltransferase [Aliivibrio salmonicida]AZL83691.1 hypothetical protein EIJ81_02500 [Aliivibrio salmonicida]AZL83717.1 hypothetical protein EIJ81_02675 [Aliivibrio salmonicida]AZL83724.1 hypothetical protein EIJ81_02760 [Aliivibrio salmonicida]CAQ77848.1 hypothetical protein VSAL_I0163 [Aliivibrio salmonicida LFI1238]CAQ77945.1 hypothetical protein VSAL_I0260 [Aliivibrio salmonicida LFI1238]